MTKRWHLAEEKSIVSCWYNSLIVPILKPAESRSSLAAQSSHNESNVAVLMWHCRDQIEFLFKIDLNICDDR